MKEHGNIEAVREELRKLDVQQKKLRKQERSKLNHLIELWLQTFPVEERIEKLEQLLEDDVMCRECGPGTVRKKYCTVTVLQNVCGARPYLNRIAHYTCKCDTNHYIILRLSEFDFTTKDFIIVLTGASDILNARFAQKKKEKKEGDTK